METDVAFRQPVEGVVVPEPLGETCIVNMNCS
jgi:hypothetical protein